MEMGDLILLETKSLFRNYHNDVAPNQYFLFTALWCAEYKELLMLPEWPVARETTKKQQHNHNNCNQAIYWFKFEHGQLWWCVIVKELCYLVHCKEDLLKHIAGVHFELEHAAVKKTYGPAAKSY